MKGKVYRVGLTGGVASGKSTVTRIFRGLGVPIIDTDELARDVVEPGQPPLERLVERFGSLLESARWPVLIVRREHESSSQALRATSTGIAQSGEARPYSGAERREDEE